MRLISALVFFVIFVLVYIIINEIFTVLFRLTGLTEEKAKFQVTSMLTNSGFTTSESEIITSSKVRSKLARMTMIFGYAFTVTIVSSLVNFIIAMNNSEIRNIWPASLAVLSILIFVRIVKKHPIIKSKFDHLIEILGNKCIFGKFSNVIVVLDSYDENVLAEIIITNVPEKLKNITIGESDLNNNYNINIMLLKREYDYMRPITTNTILQEGDTIVVFGDYKNIRQLFEKV